MEIDKLELAKGAEDLLDIVSRKLKVKRADVETMVRDLGGSVPVTVKGVLDGSDLLGEHLGSGEGRKRAGSGNGHG
jgi:hypothetical protein